MFPRILFCLVLFVSSSASLSQDRTAIAKEIQSLESKSQLIEQSIPDIEATLEKLNDALERSKRDNEQQKAKLETQKSLTDSDPSAANVRSLNLIENAVAMSERSISTQEKRIERQASKLSEAKTELNTIKRKISQNIQILATPEPKPEPKPEPQPEQKPLPEPKVEPQIEAPQVAVATETTPSAPAASATTEVSATAPEVNSSAPEAKPSFANGASDTAAQKNDSPIPVLSKYSPEQIAEAQVTVTKINERLTRSGGRPLFKFLVLKLNRKSGAKLSFIGSDTYQGDIALPAGEVSMEINGRKFKHTVAEKDGGSTHTVVVYVKNASRFDVDVFSKDLLDELKTGLQVPSEN